MQATEVASTNPYAPYDILSPMRCNHEPIPGVKCTGRAGDINWREPGLHSFRCQRCKTQNVVLIVEAGA